MKTTHPSASKGPQIPEKPAFRSLKSSAKAVKIIPYLIDGDNPELLHEDNLVVALGPLKYRSYLHYENTHDESLDVTVSKLLFAIRSEYAVSSNEMVTNELGEKVPYTIEYDEKGGVKTPYGPLSGSLERNMAELVAFILSQYGRVVEDNGDGTYEYEPITKQDILNNLDAKAVATVDEDGTSLFLEILEVSGVWQPDRVAEDLKENAEIDEEELKN